MSRSKSAPTQSRRASRAYTRPTPSEKREAASIAKYNRKVIAAATSALNRARRNAQIAARDQREFELAVEAARASGELERFFARTVVEEEDEESGDEEEEVWEDMQDFEIDMQVDMEELNRREKWGDGEEAKGDTQDGETMEMTTREKD